MKSSTDIWFCAFLRFKGFPLDSYDLVGKNKVRCNFKLPEAEWQQLKTEFNNSVFIIYKLQVEGIKDLAF